MTVLIVEDIVLDYRPRDLEGFLARFTEKTPGCVWFERFPASDDGPTFTFEDVGFEPVTIIGIHDRQLAADGLVEPVIAQAVRELRRHGRAEAYIEDEHRTPEQLEAVAAA